MKKLITLLFSCVIMLSAMAQISTKKISDKNYKHFRDSLTQIHQHNDFSLLLRKSNHQLKAKQVPALSYVKLDSVVTLEDSKYIFTYDANGRNTSEILQNWSNGVWVNSHKYIYSYDANGNIILEMDQDWTNETWVDVDKFIYDYDANGNLILETCQDTIGRPNNITWMDFYRNIYSYDDANNLISVIDQYWNDWSEPWTNSFNTIYSYDANGNVILAMDQDWTNETWVDTHQTIYSYDANGNLILETCQDTTGRPNETWSNFYRNTYSYDVNGNRILEVFSWWNDSSNDFNDLLTKSEYAFNDYTYSQAIMPLRFFKDESFNNNLTNSELSYSYDSDSWILNNSEQYYYSPFIPSGITPIKLINVSVYQKPTQDLVLFSWVGDYSTLDVEIFSIDGQKILQKTIANQGAVSIEKLATGIYIYCLTNDGVVVSSGKVNKL